MAVDDGLRKLMRLHLPQIHWQSVETGQTGQGVPDTNFCCEGVEGWVECKRAFTTQVDMRPEQIAWLLRRARAGGRVFIAVRHRRPRGLRHESYDELWLFHGKDAKRLFISGLLGPKRLGHWEGGPSRWDWNEVAEILIKS